VATSATDLFLAAYSALAPEEQEEAFARISEARLARLAVDDSETGRFVRALRRVADRVGEDPSPDDYRAARAELIAQGEDVPEINAVIRHFGSWRNAKESLARSPAESPLQIEARFRRRLLGKVHRYREDTLRVTLERCAADLGHVPLVIEFELWRQREVELAKARGEELFLPSDSPYRRRWGSWENALLHFGFTPEAIAERLEPGRERSNDSLARFQYERD
jgi:hypothetical protein